MSDDGRERLLFLPPQSDLSREWAKRLAADEPRARVELPASLGELLNILPGARAVVMSAGSHEPVAPEVFAAAGSMTWFHMLVGSPVNGFFHRALVEHPAVITNSRGVYADSTATHTMALLLALARELPRYQRHQQRHEWLEHGHASHILPLEDARVLLVGAGTVGQALAERLQGFRSKVTFVGRTRRSTSHGEVYGRADLLDLLAKADVVICSVPNLPATLNMFSDAEFQRMKPGAYFLNVGRGETADIDALARALGQGRLAGAALDVTPEEPLAADHPLWDDPRVIITPHVAGVGHGVSERRYEILLANLRRFLDGEPLLNVVRIADHLPDQKLIEPEEQP